MKRLFCLVIVCLLAASSIFGQCPPCCSNLGALPGSGDAHNLAPIPGCDCATRACPGCPGDNRRVMNIRFDTTAGSTWILGPNGHGGVIVEPVIYEAVVCAIQQWNTKVGSNGETIPYFFRINQDDPSETTPDVVISKHAPAGGGRAEEFHYESFSQINLAPSVTSIPNPDTNNCGRIAHELGHTLNIVNVDNTTGVGGCVTIMNGTYGNGTRGNNTVRTRDVDAVQRNASGTGPCSFATCPLNRREPICDDLDSDGFTTCGGDCDDTNPNLTTDCGGQCNPLNEENCYNSGGNWDSSTCNCDYGNQCDPVQEENCYLAGNEWDPATCTCYTGGSSCTEPGEWVEVASGQTTCQQCVGDSQSGVRETCTTYWTSYERYCPNGSVYDWRTEEGPQYCSSSGEYCEDVWMPCQ
jgi:hypothetical protein